MHTIGQTEARGNAGLDIESLDGDDDFLTRERAILGDDAAQFAGLSEPHSNIVENGDEDLLGGSEIYGGMESGIDGSTAFESSFPSIDTRNEVCLLLSSSWRRS